MKHKAFTLPDTKTKIPKSERDSPSWTDAFPGWSKKDSNRLYEHLRLYRELDWDKTVRAFEANPDVANSAAYLNSHPIFWTFMSNERNPQWKPNHEFWLDHESGLSLLHVDVVRTTPRGRISNDPHLNTEVRIWIEGGPRDLNLQVNEYAPPSFSYHDYRLDVGERTYEEAIIKFAKKVHRLYGNDRAVFDAENAAEIDPEVTAEQARRAFPSITDEEWAEAIGGNCLTDEAALLTEGEKAIVAFYESRDARDCG